MVVVREPLLVSAEFDRWELLVTDQEVLEACYAWDFDLKAH